MKAELVTLYDWKPEDIRSVAWHELMPEYHLVLDKATKNHFGVDKKVSTHAWAYDVARRRVRANAG
ncbi:hypothetical protein [Lentzea sp. CA-135723]|uniref:hypothetical protein n=1 Tax=Lentzea sp. CA-135723 TaxID=3239950 RepID=UPI003D904A38